MCIRVPELTKVFSRTFKFLCTLVRQCTDAPIIPPIRTDYSRGNEYRNQRRSCRNTRTSPDNVSSIRQSNVIQPVHCLQAHDYVLNGPFVPASLMQWNCALSCKAARLEYLPKQGVYRYLTVLGSLTQASDLPKLIASCNDHSLPVFVRKLLKFHTSCQRASCLCFSDWLDCKTICGACPRSLLAMCKDRLGHWPSHAEYLSDGRYKEPASHSVGTLDSVARSLCV